MKITRSRPSAEYVQVPNATARDGRLTYKARGVLLALLSLPSGATVDSNSLADEDIHGNGRDSVRAALAELQAAGYLRRTRRRGAKGLWTSGTEVFDTPQAPNASPQVAPGPGFPAPDEPAPDRPAPEDPALRTEDEGGREKGPLPPRSPAPSAPRPAGGPAGADPALVAAVDEALVERVVAHLPNHLRPLDDRERRGYERYVRQRIAVGRSPEWLIDTARTCTQLARSSRLGLWTSHIDRTWDEQHAATPPSHAERPKRPDWCGECDERSRCVLDENGYPDTTSKCERCHPHSLGAFLAR